MYLSDNLRRFAYSVIGVSLLSIGYSLLSVAV